MGYTWLTVVFHSFLNFDDTEYDIKIIHSICISTAQLISFQINRKSLKLRSNS